ncbi:DUF3262 family protein [Aromatoleum aromaticum]|uniref:DUF3262 family protein n=1 Tax=Aromatoleum aromaticum TaxID=551760 RepID=UPI0003170218|nr:DUF3262 family protein [Aromatoleum aromaticum]
MSLSSEQAAAFAQAAGLSAGDIAEVLALLVGAVVVLWAADMMRRLGMEAIDNPKRLPQMTFYKLRVLIIVLLLIYFLT